MTWEPEDLKPRGAKDAVWASQADHLQLPATASAPRLQNGQLRPVQAIRREFQDIIGFSENPEKATIDAEDVARHWERLVENDLYQRGRAHVGVQAKQVIALRAAQLMQDVDIQRKGSISIEEWLHFMLLARSGFAARQVNDLLDKALDRNKTILVELQKMFDAADSTKCGNLSVNEIVSMYSKKLWLMRPSMSGPVKNMTHEELCEESPEHFARQVIQAMDISGDEHVSYPEFMAYSLGRRKHEVVLHLYDLSNGAAKNISPWMIGKQLEGVWHTGVVVYGKEYYYSKDTVFTDAGDTSFGKPTRVVNLGHTLWRQDELHEFVTTELKPVFQRDTYDVICNNCNHFSDRVCMYLVGKHLPQEVMQQPELLLHARSIQVLRPMLNWWLRDRIVARETTLPPGLQRLKPGEPLPIGTVVSIHAAQGSGPTVLGQVTAAENRDRDDFCRDHGCAGIATPRPSAERTVALNASVCGGLWGGTCGALRLAGSSNGPEKEGVWVQYLDIAFGSSSPSRAQVRCENFPHSRLSLNGLREEGEAIFRRVFKVLHSSNVVTTTSPSGRSHQGLAPHRVAVPRSMSEDKDTREVLACGPPVSQL